MIPPYLKASFFLSNLVRRWEICLMFQLRKYTPSIQVVWGFKINYQEREKNKGKRKKFKIYLNIVYWEIEGRLTDELTRYLPLLLGQWQNQPYSTTKCLRIENIAVMCFFWKQKKTLMSGLKRNVSVNNVLEHTGCLIWIPVPLMDVIPTLVVPKITINE